MLDASYRRNTLKTILKPLSKVIKHSGSGCTLLVLEAKNFIVYIQSKNASDSWMAPTAGGICMLIKLTPIFYLCDTINLGNQVCEES